MDDNLNRAALTRQRHLLALTIFTSIGSGSLASDLAGTYNQPQRISASRTVDEGNPSVRDSSLFIREPQEIVQVPPSRSKAIEPTALAAGLTDSTNINAKPEASAYDSGSIAFASNRRAVKFQIDFDALDENPSDLPANWVEPILRIESQQLNVLPGFSLASLRLAAAKSLDESTARLTYNASHSAAAAATESLRLIAQALDTSRGDGVASADVAAALVALREAEDFVGRYGRVDATAISRMVRSHETLALKDFDTSQLTGLVAADIYLDAARQKLTTIAATDPLAAHAIALLAKSYRQQAADSPLALATSVHLMRAAVSASPNDRGLAMEFASVLEQAKLREESQEVFAKAMRMPSPTDNKASDADSMIVVVSGNSDASDPAQRAVQIEQLSPEAFATISRLEAGPNGTPAPRKLPPTQPAEPKQPAGNPVSRAFKSMTKIWQ